MLERVKKYVCSGLVRTFFRSFRSLPVIILSATQAARFRANMGAEDEWGSLFSAADVLHGKMPVNFSLEEPTTIQYLDPAFYSQVR